MANQDALTLVTEIKKFSDKLNDWEKQFLGNILGHRVISTKQSAILTKIYSKCVGGDIYEKKQYFKR